MANGLPSVRIQPVVYRPTCVAALIFVVALLVAIHAFHVEPPNHAAAADSAHKLSALARSDPMVAGTSVLSVTNMMFMFGLK